MQNMKIFSLINFVRGGKSSIARLLAEHLNTVIVNLDPKRDSEHYNAVKTINIYEDSTVTRTDNKLVVETETTISEISSKSHILICDFGGRFDERISEFKSDIYILPTMDDYESINETMKATKYILKYNPEATIIHVLNMAMCIDKAEKEDFRAGFKSNLEANELSSIKSIEMPRSKLLKKIINDGITEADVIGDNQLLRLNNYKKINKFVEELINLIEEEI